MPKSDPPRKQDAETPTRKRKKLLAYLGPIFAAAAGIALTLPMLAPAPQSVATPTIADVDFSEIKDIYLGSPEAPVTMIEYASYTCSHCANFANETFPDLKAEYIDTGKVRFAVREVVTHPAGLWGGLLARCDAASAYYDISKDIFAKFDTWTEQDSEAMRETFQQIGIANGLTAEKAAACLADEDGTAEALVARAQVLGRKDGVQGTPSFMINGVLTRNGPYEDLKEVLDEAIAAAN
jgi:protein-disulfide isomerase